MVKVVAHRPGKTILLTVAGITAVGGFFADWNRTHLFNSSWPSHAKFHDALSITLGTFLGSSGLYFLLRSSSDPKQDLRLGTTLPVFFWTSMEVSYFYPGAEGIHSEFPHLVPKIGKVWIDEKFAGGLMLLLSGIGYMLEYQRLEKEQALSYKNKPEKH